MISISVFRVLTASTILKIAFGHESAQYGGGGDGEHAKSSFSVEDNGQIVWNDQGASLVTPIAAVAVFHDAGGFRTGVARGRVTFRQANFPNEQATVIDISLYLPPSSTDRQYRLDVLFAGELEEQYCSTGKRFYTVQDFTVKAGETFYWISLKVRDLSVTDEIEGVIGRALRLACLSCGSYDGCAVIGRSDDEIYVERSSELSVKDLLPKWWND